MGLARRQDENDPQIEKNEREKIEKKLFAMWEERSRYVVKCQASGSGICGGGGRSDGGLVRKPVRRGHLDFTGFGDGLDADEEEKAGTDIIDLESKNGNASDIFGAIIETEGGGQTGNNSITGINASDGLFGNSDNASTLPLPPLQSNFSFKPRGLQAIPEAP